MRRLPQILVFLALISNIGVARAGTVRQTEGSSDVVVEGVSSNGESKVGETLPEGAVITTGNDGRMVIEVAPGIFLELQPDAQLTIGAMDPDAGMDSTGAPIPRVSVNLISGGMVVHATGGSLDATSLLVVTPKGSFIPASAGATLVSAAPPATSDGSVTVAAVTGSGIFTTTEGEQLTIGDGMMAVLGGTEPANATTISDSPQASQITETGQSSATRIASLAAPPVVLATTSLAAPDPTPLPPPPTPTPTPLPPRATPEPTTPIAPPDPAPLPSRSTPTPDPTTSITPPEPAPLPSRPTPTPDPATSIAPPDPTPLPPRPTPTPSPTPLPPRPTPTPSPTPLPPRPTPTPSPTPLPPRPTPTPSPTPLPPRPTPTPSPTPTPISP